MIKVSLPIHEKSSMTMNKRVSRTIMIQMKQKNDIEILSNLTSNMEVMRRQMEAQHNEFMKQLKTLHGKINDIEQDAYRNESKTKTTRVTKTNNADILDCIETSTAPRKDKEGNFYNSSRIHHDISHRFKDKDNKYGGSDEEDLFEHLMTYDTIAEDYEMSEDQKLRYVHNIFKKEASRYYNSNVKPIAQSYQECKTLMLLHFNSPDVQSRIKNELRTLNFENFVETEGSRAKELSKLATTITNKSKKCPTAYRSEPHRV